MFEPIDHNEPKSPVYNLLDSAEEEDIPTAASSPELTNSTLYARDGDISESIFDFEIKTVLGRGNFGKVFLV